CPRTEALVVAYLRATRGKFGSGPDSLPLRRARGWTPARRTHWGSGVRNAKVCAHAFLGTSRQLPGVDRDHGSGEGDARGQSQSGKPQGGAGGKPGAGERSDSAAHRGVSPGGFAAIVIDCTAL